MPNRLSPYNSRSEVLVSVKAMKYLLILLLSFGLIACENGAENQAEQSAQEAGQAAEDAGEAAGEAAEEAGQAAEDAAQDAEDAAEDATDGDN